MARSKLASERLASQEKVRRAVRLRLQGLNWDEVARAVGYSHRGAAWRAVNQWYDRRQAEIEEGVERCRHMDIDRLDVLLYALRGRIARGEPRAIDSGLRILERRAKLLGLDAAMRHEVTGADGGPLAIDDARALLAARLAAIAPAPESEPAPTAPGEPA